MARDGRWSAEPAGEAPYKTRMVIYRPRDPARFNGTVIVHWNNVSAGYDLYGADSLELLEGGFGFAAVTTQRVGVHGHEQNSQGLRTWDPERYGMLSIAGDDYSFDIFTQAARAVGPNRARTGVDPMGGLAVRKLIAQGASQSAGRLATYVNAIQPLEQTFASFERATVHANVLTHQQDRRVALHLFEHGLTDGFEKRDFLSARRGSGNRSSRRRLWAAADGDRALPLRPPADHRECHRWSRRGAARRARSG